MDEENPNEETTQMQEQQGQSNEQSMTKREGGGVAQAGADKLKKKITEKATQEAGKTAVKKGVMMALSHVIVYIVAFIIALVVLIGVAMFFVTMPGMLMEKLKALGKAIGDAWASWFGQSDDTFVDHKQIYEVMDYIEEMGYSLKEYGFLTHYLEEDDAVTTRKVEYNGENITHEDLENNSEEQVVYDEDQGVFRSSDSGKIVAGCSDFIMQYIISDNYMYTIRNFNVDTDNWWSAVFDHIKALFSDDMSNRRGMIFLLHDNGEIGMAKTNSRRNRRCI